jgi:glyoxylase-like metal-dependent hydrolase (beta-lactamase superfamily II)
VLTSSSGNVGVWWGPSATVLVDDGTAAQSAQLLEAVARLSRAPVRFVVNTHWHNDHVAGNAIYARAWPEARFVAHEFTARLLDEQVRPYMGPACATFVKVQSKFYRDLIASGKAPDGTPLPEARRQRIQGALDEADRGIEECTQMEFRGTDVAFTDRLRVRLGQRVVEVLFLGRANTAGDALVYVPDAKVLATGDVVVFPFPFAFQTYVSEWAAVLRRVEAMDTVAIVPGHGPVMRDKAYVRTIAEFAEFIDAQVRARYTPGMTVAQLREAIDFEPFRKRIAGDDPLVNANFEPTLVLPALTRAWQAARGELAPEGLPRNP